MMNMKRDDLDPLTCDLALLPPLCPDFGPNLEPECEWPENPIWHRLKLEQVRDWIREWFKNRPAHFGGVVMGYDHEPGQVTYPQAATVTH